MHILETVLERELAELHKQGVQLRHIGHLEGLPGNLQEKVRKAVELTRDNTRLTLCVAFNYGGRDEIVCALRQMAAEGLKPEEITEESISAHLFTAGIPDPDLIIRTSGELRTSNFLIWQAAYAEYYPTPLFWPDFDKEALREAILAYGKRERRFGRVSAQES